MDPPREPELEREREPECLDPERAGEAELLRAEPRELARELAAELERAGDEAGLRGEAAGEAGADVGVPARDDWRDDALDEERELEEFLPTTDVLAVISMSPLSAAIGLELALSVNKMLALMFYLECLKNKYNKILKMHACKCLL